ncbi:LysR family transcriptional regulator [Cognatishimia sp. WU-CL00825]|uniref:LysR family transcriptional regulator n=1 Tax=Cognatishimia sp. WU-CL00825 TaxID=3127658 RepID=UPI00310935C7
MNVPQLSAFCEVMKTGSVSQAARNLGRTQPAISLSIKSLEEILGVTLFRREGRQLLPVPEAQYLFAEASNILARLNTVKGTMNSLSQGLSGELNVSAMPGPSTYLFPQFIAESTRKNENILVSLSSRSTQQIRELVGAQMLDFGFADASDVVDPNALYSEEVISGQCLCAVPAGHPLARKSKVSIKDLDGAPLGTLQSGHPLHLKTLKAFEENGAQFRQKVDSQIILPMMQFVNEGLCIVITDPLSALTQQQTQPLGSRITFVPLADPILYNYAILTPRHRPVSQLAKRILTGWRDRLALYLQGPQV